MNIFDRALVITCTKRETNERDVIEIAPNLVRDVMGLFSNDYSRMLVYMKVQDQKVVLLNPRLNSLDESTNPIIEPDYDKKDQTGV